MLVPRERASGRLREVYDEWWHTRLKMDSLGVGQKAGEKMDSLGAGQKAGEKMDSLGVGQKGRRRDEAI